MRYRVEIISSNWMKVRYTVEVDPETFEALAYHCKHESLEGIIRYSNYDNIALRLREGSDTYNIFIRQTPYKKAEEAIEKLLHED